MMRFFYSAVVLSLLTAGCVRGAPPTSQPVPPPVSRTPETSQPAPAPVAETPGTSQPAPPAVAETPEASQPAPPVVAGTPEASQPDEPAVARRPERSQPAATPGPVAKSPASTTEDKAAQPAAKAPAARGQAPSQVAPSAPTAPPRQTAAATLDLSALKTRLKETKAIGVFTKITLKNQVDDLLGKFRQHHAGKPTPTVAELRRSYDLLLMKVLSLLQDDDQKLASDILSSRDRIWDMLADPKKFATLDA